MNPVDYGDDDCIPGIVSKMRNQESLIIDLRNHLEYELEEAAKELMDVHAKLEQHRAAMHNAEAAAAKAQELD